MKSDIIFLLTASDERIEGRIVNAFYNLSTLVKDDYVIRRVKLIPFYINISLLLQILRSRVLVLHSPVLHVFPVAVLAWLFGVKLCAFAWDYYPVKISGKRYDSRVSRRISDVLEILVFKLCSQIFVPSNDFLPFNIFSKAKVLKMWPQFVLRNFNDDCYDKKNGPLRIIFAGQVNKTRGLDEVLDILKIKCSGDFKLLIASGDVLPKEISNHPNVVNLGRLSFEDLKIHYRVCDFGLVSISTGFDGPAFPSKTFEYIENGLPIIYHGPNYQHFLGLIENSSLGVALVSHEKINRDVSSILRNGFQKKSERLMSSVCLDEREFIKFLNLTNV